MAMFYEIDIDSFNRNELFQVVGRELFLSNFGSPRFDQARNVPTHTEDGIPIRKLYVSNLPPNTTRAELFSIFAPYGFIKSCWLRMGDRGTNRAQTPTYAFVTFSNPADAHKALLAPYHEKQLRGNSLKIFPADSWHQPLEDSDGRVHWKPRGGAYVPAVETENQEEAQSTEAVENPEGESSSKEAEDNSENNEYGILEILNTDCLAHIFSYVPIRDLIKSERVSKQWRDMVNDQLQSIRTFRTSWWSSNKGPMTTAVLRKLLQRFGNNLLRLYIDHRKSALNDRTAHTIGKFCPNLEELKVVNLPTKNWNPLLYGCKELKNITFFTCNRLTDASLGGFSKEGSSVKNITIGNNPQITGLFLTGTRPSNLTSLSFFNCDGLRATVLIMAMEALPNLTTLRLDMCPIVLWEMMPFILKRVPQLEELSLSSYTMDLGCYSETGADEFSESLSHLKKLKRLNLCRNMNITNTTLKHIALYCPKIEWLDISGCYFSQNAVLKGVSDEGLASVCSSCTSLTKLDVSALPLCTATGFAAIAKLKQLEELTARHNTAATTETFTAILKSCHQLKVLDLCGCESISEEILAPAVRELEEHPRVLTLMLSGTFLADHLEVAENLPSHKLLVVDYQQETLLNRIRCEIMDNIFDDSSDDSYDNLMFDHQMVEDFMEHMISSDEEYFLDDQLIDYEGEFEDELYDNGILF